jgi:hypothetical protein
MKKRPFEIPIRGALSSAELDYEEPYSGLPRLSSIPVHVAIEPRSGS